MRLKITKPSNLLLTYTVPTGRENAWLGNRKLTDERTETEENMKRKFVQALTV